MNEGLQQITDWSDRAAAALWCVTALAEGSHVSIATLERHFRDTMQHSPRGWLARERLRRAVELLADGCSIKETSSALAYKNQHHFSLAFKKHFGYPPKLHRRQTPDARRQTPNAKRQTPNAKRQTPNAKRQTPNAKKPSKKGGLTNSSTKLTNLGTSPG